MDNRTSPKARLGFIVCLIIICLITATIQQQLFISWDISALLHSTEKLMQGGNYIDDFFIPNSPMIMYLYIPPLALAKLLQVNVTVMFPLYIFMLAVISYLVCFKLLEQIFLENDWFKRYLFAIVLAIVFLIVPIYEFGQRDHLLVMLAMPYLLAMVCRLDAKPLSRNLMIAIGVFAGFGIAIKPQFLVLPVVMELYYMYRQRSWISWNRPEAYAILAVQVLYLTVVLLTRQDYLTVMVPYLAKYYYKSSLISWYTFLFNDSLLYIYAALVLAGFLNKMNPYTKFSGVLSVAVVAYLIIYLLQGFVYFYHIVPPLSLTILLLAQLYSNLLFQKQYDCKWLAIPAIAMLILLAYQFDVSFSLMYTDPAQFFVLFSGFFIGLFFIVRFHKNVFVVLLTLLMMVVVYLFFTTTLSSMTYLMQNIITLGLLLTLLKVRYAKTTSSLLRDLFTAILGVLLFMVPCLIELNAYGAGMQYKRVTLNKLINFIHTLPPHQSIYMLSTGIHFTYPMASYTDVDVVQRFDALWMVRGFIKQIVKENRQVVQDNIKNNTSKTFIVNIIAEDLRTRKPDLVFVETRYKGQRSISFNFLEYFLQSDAFRDVWQNYHYLTTVDQPGAFKLDVYRLQPAKY